MTTSHLPLIDLEAFATLPKHGVIAIDFAAAWCGPCKAMLPILTGLAREYADQVRMVAVDVDHEQALAEQFSVRSMPTFVILRDGREVGRIVGSRPRGSGQRAIEDALDEAARPATSRSPRRDHADSMQRSSALRARCSSTATWFVVSPSACAAASPDSSSVRRIFRRDGAIIVGSIKDAVGVLARPGERLAVMQDDLAIYDTRRATLVRRIDVVPPELPRAYGESPQGGETMADPLVWLGDDRVAIVVRSKQALEVAVVSLDAGVVTRRVHIPICDDDTRSETSTSAANGTDR